MYEGTNNQLTQVLLSDGTVASLVDYTSRTLYSTIELWDQFRCEEVRFFSYEEGEQVVTSPNMPQGLRRYATDLETNARASEMADTEGFLIMNIGLNTSQFAFPAGSDDTVTWDDEDPALLLGSCMPTNPVLCALNENILIKLELAGIKDYQEAHFVAFPSGQGIVTDFGPAATSTRSYANNSVPSEEAMRPFDLPVPVSSTEEYSVLFCNPRGRQINFLDDAGLDGDAGAYRSLVRVRCSLHGLHKRGVK